MKKHIPNIITLFRIVLVFIFIVLFRSDLEGRRLYCTAIFVLAGLSDLLDGYLARKYQLESDFGKLMDPVADKLMQITVAISVATAEKSLIWVPIFLIVKEISMLLGAARLLKNKNIVVKANWAGKLASVIYFLVFLSILLFEHRLPPMAMQLMCGSFVVFSVLAFFIYLNGYLKVNREQKSQ